MKGGPAHADLDADGDSFARHPAGRPIERATRLLALAGGLVLLAAAAAITLSVLSRWLAGRGIGGDFEMMEMASALAIFAFLPFCQARRGNVMVDTFTTWLPSRARRLLDGLWDLVFAALALVIAWQSVQGGLAEIGYGTTSMVAGIPIGPVVVATGLLAFVLAIVALATAARLAIGRP